MYPDFELDMPERLEAALAALDGGGAVPVPLAGGTNLLVDLRARRTRAERLLALGGLEALGGIEIGPERVRCGARTTVAELLRHPQPAALGRSLVAAARVFAGQMVRNAATVGGNLCYGSPAADLVAPLLALDAEVELASRAGTRRLGLAEFLVDYRETARRDDELLTAVEWPRPRGAERFYKLARRRGDAITVTGVAVALGLEDGRCRGVRIALGAVAPTVLRARAAEACLEGHPPEPARLAEAARQAAAEARPIDDLRASAGYRRHAVRVLVARLLAEACAVPC